jgi:hypothetical protein
MVFKNIRVTQSRNMAAATLAPQRLKYGEARKGKGIIECRWRM